MEVNLSIKGVPAPLAAALKERASANHRSLQGELMAIIEAAIEGADNPAVGAIARANKSAASASRQATSIAKLGSSNLWTR